MKSLYKLGVQYASKLGLYVERSRTHFLVILRILLILRRSNKRKSVALDLGCDDDNLTIRVSRLYPLILAIVIRLSSQWTRHNDVYWIVADARFLPFKPRA